MNGNAGNADMDQSETDLFIGASKAGVPSNTPALTSLGKIVEPLRERLFNDNKPTVFTRCLSRNDQMTSIFVLKSPLLIASTKNTEPELVALLKNKDQQAYNFLYDNYAGALYGVIIKILDKQETARDILQEVFVKIWRNIDSYDASRGRLYTWMLNIARNAAIDMLRSSGYNQEKKTLYSGDDISAQESGRSISMKTDHIGLQQLLLVLKAEYRQIIDLAYFKGYTQEEIAKELGIPIGTVKTRCRKALSQLKDIMKS